MKVSTLFDSVMMGSTSEGLSVPDHMTVMSGESLLIGGDKDDMLSNRNHYVIDDLPPEAAHLREGATFVIEPIDGIPCTYAALRVTEGFKKACEATGDPLRYDYIFNTTVTTEGVTNRMRVIPSQPAEVHGPSVTVLNRPLPLLDRDECAAVVFEGWPEVAHDWPGRHRPSNWPPSSAIDEVVRGGFHMVPVGVSTDPEKRKLEWRYSFSMAEQRLAKYYLPDIARKAYIYLKMLRSHYFDLPSALPTYYMKTFFLWLCERRPAAFWDDSKMADILHNVLDELLHAVALRDIRHYFIAGVNLLEHIQPSFASDLVTKISRVRRDLVASLLRIDDRVRFIELANRRHARVLLSAPLSDMTAKDAVTSVGRFDHSRRVALDAMFTETLSVLIKIADAAESLTDQTLRLLYDINTNTFMCIVDSLLREAYDIDAERLAFPEYLISTLLRHPVSATLLARFMCFFTTARGSKRASDRESATAALSAAIDRLHERSLSADISDKLNNAVYIFRDTNIDDLEFNNRLQYRKFFHMMHELRRH